MYKLVIFTQIVHNLSTILSTMKYNVSINLSYTVRKIVFVAVIIEDAIEITKYIESDPIYYPVTCC